MDTQHSWREIDGVEAVRTDHVTDDHTAHMIALYSEDAPYSTAAPLDRSMVLIHPHAPAGWPWTLRTREDVCGPVEETLVSPQEGQDLLDYWDLVRRASMAPSVTE